MIKKQLECFVHSSNRPTEMRWREERREERERRAWRETTIVHSGMCFLWEPSKAQHSISFFCSFCHANSSTHANFSRSNFSLLLCSYAFSRSCIILLQISRCFAFLPFSFTFRRAYLAIEFECQDKRMKKARNIFKRIVFALEMSFTLGQRQNMNSKWRLLNVAIVQLALWINCHVNDRVLCSWSFN